MNQRDIRFMQEAIREAANSKSKDPRDPKVGAVIVKDGKVLDKAYRGETGKGHHAEFVVLQKKLRSKDLLKGATLYTTLEPCTTRKHDKLPCVDWIVRKEIGRVVMGILDPNPNICGRGYWRLWDAKILVEFFPPELARKIVEENRPFIQRYRGGEQYDASFAWMVERHKSPIITPYSGIGWGDALSLQTCPNLREGWPMSQVELCNDDDRWFSLPNRDRNAYKKYFDEQYEVKRFHDDGEKFMLTCNPTAFSKSLTLKLRTISALYSECHYYLDNVAIIAAKRNSLIEELIKGSLEAHFPHALCMHMVVATKDNKILITKRSPKVGYHINTWSVSVEDTLTRKDLDGGLQRTVLNWGKRLLWDELGLDSSAYHPDNLRVLSVFLEGDILNISICAYAELNLDSPTLDKVLRGALRTDDEFTEWLFLELQQEEMIKELTQPTRSYHPTSGYRMLMALLKQFGVPKELEKTLP